MSIEQQFLVALGAVLILTPLLAFLAISHVGWAFSLARWRRFGAVLQALLFLLALGWLLASVGILPPLLPRNASSAAGYALAAALAGKAAAAYIPAAAADGAAGAFARRDRRIYAPLSLLCAAGTALLLSFKGSP